MDGITDTSENQPEWADVQSKDTAVFIDLDAFVALADRLLQEGHFAGPGDMISWMEEDILPHIGTLPTLQATPAYTCDNPGTDCDILGLLGRNSGYVLGLIHKTGTVINLRVTDIEWGDGPIYLEGDVWDEETGRVTDDHQRVCLEDLHEVHVY